MRGNFEGILGNPVEMLHIGCKICGVQRVKGCIVNIEIRGINLNLCVRYQCYWSKISLFIHTYFYMCLGRRGLQ